jgi:sirohydrochlorin cobaltochelatase
MSADDSSESPNAPSPARPDGVTTTLLLVGHGSLSIAATGAPVRAHADHIRASAPPDFHEVATAFWKEEPWLTEALRIAGGHRVVVVPLLMARGYFADRVVPRELGLEASRSLTGALVAGRWVVYAAPVGTHSSLARTIAEAARSCLAGAGASADRAALVVVGHGTGRHAQSSRAVEAHIAALSGRFREARAAFLDQSPDIATTVDDCAARDVVVVPFFAAAGRHSQRDIRAALGVPKGGGPGQFPIVRGRHRLWITSPIGTDPGVADVILRRAREALEAAPLPSDFRPVEPLALRAHRAFADGVDSAGRCFGQLFIQRDRAAQRWTLRHVDDRDRRDLEQVVTVEALAEISRLDALGRHRPLCSAPTLCRGWRLGPLDRHGLRRALDTVYPGAVPAWYEDREGVLEVTSLRGVLGRQTGRYAVLRELDDVTARETVAEVCRPARCLRRLQWRGDGGPTADSDPGGTPLLCREPCRLLLAELVDRSRRSKS